MVKITGLANELTDPQSPDLLAAVDDGDDETKKMKLSSLLSLIYPIGSLYFNAEEDTNPGTLFGFGTWARYAVGRVVVGVNEADADFGSAGLTGGQKTVQAHSHGFQGDGNGVVGGVGGAPAALVQGGTAYRVFTATAVSGSGATNMNPFETAFIWKRTA